MSSTNNQTIRSEKLPPQQSDIVIELGGKVHISFLWDDLNDLPSTMSEQVSYASKVLDVKPNWRIPLMNNLEEIHTEYESCSLCPKKCGFNRFAKRHPTCGDWQLRVSTSGLSFGDEPEIRGSRGSGVIMLSGCPLKCPSCHNPEKVSDGKAVSRQEFLEICKTLYDRGAHNIQILSPTVHLPHLVSILKVLKKNHFPIPIIFKSSGFESIEQIRKLDQLVDIFLPDFKFGECSQWAKRAGAKNYFEKAQSGLNEMIQQVGPLVLDSEGLAIKGVLVRHVEAPLPVEEKNQIRNFLQQLPEGVAVSYQNTFVTLE